MAWPTAYSAPRQEASDEAIGGEVRDAPGWFPVCVEYPFDRGVVNVQHAAAIYVGESRRDTARFGILIEKPSGQVVELEFGPYEDPEYPTEMVRAIFSSSIRRPDTEGWGES